MAAQRAANASLLTTMRQVKDLSPSERHIVEYIFNNLQSVTNMGIVEMGERTFTSSTTVKRLCRKLGIESYTDFRLRLSAEIASYSHMNILQGAQSPVDRYDTINDIINKVSDQNAKSIIDTSTLNPPDVIMDVINLMKNATNIDFYGCGPSNVVAMDAQLKCMRHGIRGTKLHVDERPGLPGEHAGDHNFLYRRNGGRYQRGKGACRQKYRNGRADLYGGQHALRDLSVQSVRAGK